MDRNVSFDFLRGVMALLVCLGHYRWWSGQNDVPLSFILGVDFFLVLSGFVLSAALFPKGGVSVLRFLRLRYARLAPVYLVTIALTVPPVLWWRGLAGPSLFDLVQTVTFGQMLPVPHSEFVLLLGIGIGWTLSAELWAGVLIFPLAVALGRRSRPVLSGLLTVLACLCLLYIADRSRDYLNVHFDRAGGLLYLGLVRCLADYAIGVLAYLAYTASRPPRPMLQSALQILLAATILLLFARMGYDRRFEFLAPALFALLILSLSWRDGLLYRAMDNRLGIGLGDISYPVYLLHPFVIFAFTEATSARDLPGATLIYLATASALALAVNRAVERPAMACFKRRPSAQAAP